MSIELEALVRNIIWLLRERAQRPGAKMQHACPKKRMPVAAATQPSRSVAEG